jgi:hypothetical protein
MIKWNVNLSLVLLKHEHKKSVAHIELWMIHDFTFFLDDLYLLFPASILGMALVLAFYILYFSRLMSILFNFVAFCLLPLSTYDSVVTLIMLI